MFEYRPEAPNQRWIHHTAAGDMRGGDLVNSDHEIWQFCGREGIFDRERGNLMEVEGRPMEWKSSLCFRMANWKPSWLRKRGGP